MGVIYSLDFSVSGGENVILACCEYIECTFTHPYGHRVTVLFRSFFSVMFCLFCFILI